MFQNSNGPPERSTFEDRGTNVPNGHLTYLQFKCAESRLYSHGSFTTFLQRTTGLLPSLQKVPIRMPSYVPVNTGILDIKIMVIICLKAKVLFTFREIMPEESKRVTKVSS